MSSKSAKLLIVGGRDSPEIAAVLPTLPEGVEIVAIGKNESEWNLGSDDAWASIDVLLNCGVGANAAKRQDLQAGALCHFAEHHASSRLFHAGNLGQALWPKMDAQLISRA